ncbi:uncharacterized protein LOC136093202 [Hydra vulgaris]|uniref:uncharacterized protein LOC136093202 n=1 Tax=Hydra vulgaris TaxID=6087 RepID=UPI0032EA3F2B
MKIERAAAEELNNYFVNIGPKLAGKIPFNSTPFDLYLKTYDKLMDETNLKLSELRAAFSSLKSKKSEGFDKISVDIVKSVFDIIKPSLFHVFDLSFKTGIVPDKLKIARITPIFKSGDKSNILNYRPISILPCSSKLLERIMYNRLYNYLTENNMLYCKQFDQQDYWQMYIEPAVELNRQGLKEDKDDDTSSQSFLRAS